MVKGEIRLSSQAKLSTMMIRRSIRSELMAYLESNVDDKIDNKDLIINYILYYVMHKYRDARKFSNTRLDIIITYINHFQDIEVNDGILDTIRIIDTNTLETLSTIESSKQLRMIDVDEFYLKVKPFWRPWRKWMYVSLNDDYQLTLDKNKASVFSQNGLYKAQDYYFFYRQKLERYQGVSIYGME